VYFDAGLEFDLQQQNVEWWGILLEMIWQVDEQLSQLPYNLRIPDDLRDNAIEWLARVVTKKTERAEMEASLTTEFEASAGLPLFAKVKAALKALVKTGSSTLKEIQQEAERRPTVLHDAVKAFITHVQEALHTQGRHSLVIIADGLEKLRQALGLRPFRADEQHEKRQRDVALADPARYTHERINRGASHAVKRGGRWK